ncbi:CopG family transcriptional regulator [Bifidobacterium aquikefiricola]|uniref:CopG family transcriptional regulator n=1 Tax=Bifidobacterium aquikefiricola TaxID=3059038 RepID=A0AB39U6D1_9BIFI
MSMSQHDVELLRKFGMSSEQVEKDAGQVESETVDDRLTDKVYYGLHLAQSEEEMATVSFRLPKSTLDRITRDAERFHISRSEYLRRKLV